PRPRIPPELKAILLLFVTSRIALTLVGVVARLVLGPFHPKRPRWIYSQHLWLDLWGVWDTDYYLRIAEHGYSDPLQPAARSDSAFFPLYPLLIRAFAAV